jgi:integration host factor subunit alpha
MVKIGIANRICEKVGFSNKEAAKTVETVFNIIKETLQHEDKILISGFGNFVIRNKRARGGRNPQTGGDIEIAPRRILTFKPSAVLKASLNRSGNQ